MMRLFLKAALEFLFTIPLHCPAIVDLDTISVVMFTFCPHSGLGNAS